MIRDKPGERLTVAGPARPDLAKQRWRVFLKVEHSEGVDQFELRAESPNAAPLTWRSSTKPDQTVPLTYKKILAECRED
jgi:hypothetical protein